MKEKNIIAVEIVIQASLEKVWECWTSPQHIVHWNFATNDWCCPSAVNNLKPEGKFNWRMEAKDGSVGFDFTGVYKEVKKGQLITYKMSDGRIVKIHFLEVGDSVKITEKFEAEGANSDEQQRAGWQSILSNFKQYAESV